MCLHFSFHFKDLNNFNIGAWIISTKPWSCFYEDIMGIYQINHFIRNTCIRKKDNIETINFRPRFWCTTAHDTLTCGEHDLQDKYFLHIFARSKFVCRCWSATVMFDHRLVLSLTLHAWVYQTHKRNQYQLDPSIFLIRHIIPILEEDIRTMIYHIIHQTHWGSLRFSSSYDYAQTLLHHYHIYHSGVAQYNWTRIRNINHMCYHWAIFQWWQ